MIILIKLKNYTYSLESNMNNDKKLLFTIIFYKKIYISIILQFL